MKPLITIINYTLKEALRRKIIYAYAALVFISLAFVYFVSNLSVGGSGGNQAEISMQSTSMQTFAMVISTKVLAGFGGFFSIMVFFSTLTIFPLLFAKGETELFLTKPIERSHFFLGRMLGGILLGGVTALLFAVGVFVICGVRFAYWDWHILMFPAFAVVGVASIFAGTVVISMLTNSPVAGLILSYSMFLLPPAKELLVNFPALKTFAKISAAIIPNISSLFSAFPAQFIRGELHEPLEQFVIAGLFIIISFAVSILIFEKRDI